MSFKKSQKRSERFRNFSGVLYVEHVGNQLECLEFLVTKFGCSCAVSPLHKYDIEHTNFPRFEGFGILKEIAVLKKPHYHVLLCFQNQRSLNGVRENLKGVGLVQRLERTKTSMLRYFLHLDNPEKTNYKNLGMKIVSHDLNTDCILECESEFSAMKIIANICVNNGITNIKQLIQFLCNSSDYAHLLLNIRKSVYFYKEFSSSFYAQDNY